MTGAVFVNRSLTAYPFLVLVLAAFAAVSSVEPTLCHADEPPTDPDFYVQGEYVGTLLPDERSAQSVGFQVVALGEGKFQGSLLSGGLPGGGWDRSERRIFQGERQGDRITLTDEKSGWVAWMAASNTRYWHFADPQSGRQLGTLSGIHRQSATLGLQPGPNASVLFDGHSTSLLKDAEVDEDGLLKEGFLTQNAYQDFRLHVEFRTPWEPQKSGQGRGNSGVYIQTRYEVQVLDSFGLEELFNGCGALYRQRAPDLNMALPPRSWQTYDIEFRAARWDDEGNKIENARISVRQNGVYIHRNVEITNKTGAGSKEGPNPLPIRFQNHSNPVRYRNLWIVPLDEANALAGMTDTTSVVEGTWESDFTAVPTHAGPFHVGRLRDGQRSLRRGALTDGRRCWGWRR